MGMVVAGVIIHNYYGSCPHSLCLAPVRESNMIQQQGLSATKREDENEEPSLVKPTGILTRLQDI